MVDQQVRANSLRDLLLQKGAAKVVCATWFTLDTTLAAPGDLRLKEEDDFEELVMGGGFDLLIGDKTLWRIVKDYRGETISLPQFPVSGDLGGDGA